MTVFLNIHTTFILQFRSKWGGEASRPHIILHALHSVKHYYYYYYLTSALFKPNQAYLKLKY